MQDNESTMTEEMDRYGRQPGPEDYADDDPAHFLQALTTDQGQPQQGEKHFDQDMPCVIHVPSMSNLMLYITYLK